MRNWKQSLLACLIFLCAAVAPGAASAALSLPFELSVDGSFFKPSSDGSVEFPSAQLSLELPTFAGELVSGDATLNGLFAPDEFSTLGLYFELYDLPDVILGSFVRVGNTGSLVFEAIALPFYRGSNSGDGDTGVLTLSLTTGTATIPSNCDNMAGREDIGAPIDISALEAGSSGIGLVGNRCGYSTDSQDYDSGFVLSLYGTVPEPSSALLLSFGFVLLASRRLEAPIR